MTSKPKAIVFLEPINHVFKVILAAADMGYRIILMYKSPPFAPTPYEAAMDAVDLSITVDDWFNEPALFNTLKAQAGDYDLVGCYTGAEITLTFLASLQEDLGLPTIGRAHVDELLNKCWVRKRLLDAGLTKLNCFSGEEAQQLSEWPFAGDAMFKPCNGGASAMVRRCSSLDDLHKNIQNWDNKADEITNLGLLEYIEANNQFFIEECASGELLSVESLVYNDEITHLGILSRTVLQRDPTIEMGACFPRKHPLQDKILEKVSAIHRAVGVNYGSTHVEVMVSDDDEIELIEFNLRFAGADAMEIISSAYQHNVAKEVVKLSLGKAPELAGKSADRVASMQYLLAPENISTLDSIDYPEGTDISRVHLPAGTKLGANRNQIDWVGSFIVSAESYDEILHTLSHVRSNICINGELISEDENNQVIVN